MKQQSCTDRSSRQRAPMIPGQVIIAQHMLTKQWDQRATIIESRSNGRSYLVRMNNGRQYLRNRRFLPPSPVQKDPARSVDTSEVPCGTDAVPKPTVTTHRYPKRNRQRRMSLEPDEPQKRRQCFQKMRMIPHLGEMIRHTVCRHPVLHYLDTWRTRGINKPLCQPFQFS